MARLPKRFAGPIDQLLASIVSNVETAFQIRSRLNGMKTVSSTASIQSWGSTRSGTVGTGRSMKELRAIQVSKAQPFTIHLKPVESNPKEYSC